MKHLFSIFSIFGEKKVSKPFPKVDAASAPSNHVKDLSSGEDVKIVETEEDGTKKKKRAKEKVGFRDRKVIYETSSFEVNSSCTID